MLKSERKQFILEKVLKETFVSLDTLVQELGMSESTVRRDLDELEAESKLRRVHGGAESLHFLQEEESNTEKSIKNIQFKSKIALKAAEMIQDHDVIFIDAGTTNELLVQEIVNPTVTVVTNSIHHATKLVERNVPTVIIGGKVKSSTDASIGGIALNQIGQLNFDKAFLGMNGIDNEFYSTPDLEEGSVKRAIIENAKKTYILADDSKIGVTSFVKVAPIKRAVIITSQCDPQRLQVLKEKTEVIEV